MNYRVTCLTPTLIGDGQKLAPIDYMVWKDHVNVLDQRRIFKLLAKGPRLDGYLAQLKRAERLDFAEWGGFAQNFAGRRIPFEHSSSIPVWEKADARNLFIPTFAVSTSGPYLPATAVKGALRTGTVFDRWTENTLQEIEKRMNEDRPPRLPAARGEEAALGGHAQNRMRRVSASDSANINYAGMKIYLLRVSTLIPRGPGRFEVGWKTPVFAEMAAPGTAFEGGWNEKSISDRNRLFGSSNRYAASQIAQHKKYAEITGLGKLAETLATLEKRVEEVSSKQGSCVLSLGWGGGMLSKVAVGDTNAGPYRSILKHVSLYSRALQTGLPFPKTRKIISEGGQPASLPGWVLLEVA